MELAVRQEEAGQEDVFPGEKLFPLPRISEECIRNAYLSREASALSDRLDRISVPPQPAWLPAPTQPSWPDDTSVEQPSWPDETSVLSGFDIQTIFEYGMSPSMQASFPNLEGATPARDAVLNPNPMITEAFGETAIDVDVLEKYMLDTSDDALPLCERRKAKSLTNWYEDAFEVASTKAATPQEDCSDASSNSSHCDSVSCDPVRFALADAGDASTNVNLLAGTTSARTEVFFLFDPSGLEESVVEEFS